MRRFRYISARSKRRHPAERGTRPQREMTAFFRRVLKRIWKRHPAPFAKTYAGRLRRQLRRFVRETHNVATD